MKDPYPMHGRRRRLRVLWTVGCRCGRDAYPCMIEEMLAARRQPQHAADPGPLRMAGSRDTDRRWWPRGAR